MSTKMTLDAEDLNLVRQWFDAVQDLNPAYLTDADYELAQDIYEKLEMRVPSSILNGLKGDDSHRSGGEHK